MKTIARLLSIASGLLLALPLAGAADSNGASPTDFAYRMQVTGTGDAAAYRVALPLAVYQKIIHPDLSDLRVFNGAGEQVPFAIERPAAETASTAATALPLFPLKDDSNATLEALRVTIESSQGAINLQASGQVPPADRINTYLVDARTVEVPIAALQLQWPEDAADFAGRVKVEASDILSDWRPVVEAAPVANLHANSGRLVEQRVEFSPNKAKFWRLSWVGSVAPFVLKSVLAEPAKHSVAARHLSLNVAAKPAKDVPGEFAYDLRALVPIDRVNLELPDINTVVEVELLSRHGITKPWQPVRRAGFYRLKSDGTELSNGPVAVPLNTNRYWLVRADLKGGGMGKLAPNLIVEWVPHELVFVARGTGPFYVAYGSAGTHSAAASSLALLPKNVSIAPASLSEPEPLGGDVRLRPLPAPYAWKTALLWAVLIAGAALLAWMAFRLSRDVKRS
jgi:Protein of unknown function (DUF3999)